MHTLEEGFGKIVVIENEELGADKGRFQLTFGGVDVMKLKFPFLFIKLGVLG